MRVNREEGEGNLLGRKGRGAEEVEIYVARGGRGLRGRGGRGREGMRALHMRGENLDRELVGEDNMVKEDGKGLGNTSDGEVGPC